MPRRELPAGPRAIPFYTAAASAAKESSAAGYRPGPVGETTSYLTTPMRAGLASASGVSDFDLPGRLFGASGVLRRSREASAADAKHSSLSDLGSTRKGSEVMETVTSPHHSAATEEASGGSHPHTMVSGAPIPDAEFIADVLFMWMGVESTQFFVYDVSRKVYRLSDGMGSVLQMHGAAVFQECGVLARHIDLLLRQMSSTDESFLQQSLRSALRRQLTQYHYLIATIRERTTPPLRMGDLVVAFKRVQPKLWAMEHILRETQQVKGGELASKLQLLVQQGSHRLTCLLSDIYIETVSPLLHMTVEGITKGEVCDPLAEFFIVPNHEVDDSADNFWVAKYSLNTSMLPSTVPVAVAENILLVTKNLRFIRSCCRAKQWRMDRALVAEAERATFDTLPAVVEHALVHTNSAVLRLVREEFHLLEVLRLANAFLLVGYGDFYEVLIKKLEPILSRMSNAVQVSFVRDQVQSALVEIAPYSRHLDTNLFDYLHCELVKDDTKLGWDAFVMTMAIPSPLNNIFDVAAMKVYRRLFRMMFKVKVAEVVLKQAWQQSVALDRLISTLQRRDAQVVMAWRGVAADAHLLGLQLNHFVNNLWSYLVAEVCAVAQDLLSKAIQQCTSMDDIRTAHNSYLAYLTQRSLLHTDCASIRMNLENLLTIVREYCVSQALLTTLLQRGSGDLSTVQRQYESLTDDFHREMSSLLTLLEEQHSHYGFLNFLLLRLNFNRYYHDTAVTAHNTEF